MAETAAAMTTVTAMPFHLERCSTCMDSGPVSIAPAALSYAVEGLGRNPLSTWGTSASIIPASPATASRSDASAMRLPLPSGQVDGHCDQAQQREALPGQPRRVDGECPAVDDKGDG